MKRFFLFILLTTCYVLLTSPVHASYILPYPSYMPGNKMYRVSRIVDTLKNYWYFGNIAQIKYHLGLSDKYLVESKILFEYNQYLLATDALTRSDTEFMQLPTYIHKASVNGEDVTNFVNIIDEASKKHRDVLSGILEIVPDDFTWTPEKEKAIDLNLHKIIQTSMDLRLETVRQMNTN